MKLFYLLSLFFIASCAHSSSKIRQAHVSQKNIIYDKQEAKKDYHMLLGHIHSEKRDSKKASQEFQKALDKANNSSDLQKNLIKLYLAEEHFKNELLSEAMPLLKEILQTDPKNYKARTNLALVLIEIGSIKEGLKEYRVVLKQQPQDHTLLKNYFFNSLKFNHFKNTLKILTKALKNPNLKEHYYEYHHMKALVYFTINEKKNKRQVERELQRALKLKPNFSLSAITLSQIYEKDKKFRAQEQVLETYLKFTEFFDVRIGKDLVSLYHKRKKLKKSLKLLSELRKRSPENSELWLHEIVLLVASNKTKKAAQEISLFLKAHPTQAQEKSIFVLIHLNSGNFDKALESFENLDKNLESYEEALWMIVNFRIEQKQQEEALSFLDKHVEFFKKSSSFLHYSFLLSVEKEHQKSISVLQKGLKKLPEDEEILFYLGSLHYELGDEDKMAFFMKKVLLKNPDNYQALNHLSYAMAEKGVELDQALEWAQKALELSPESGHVLDTLGWIFYKKKEFQKARRYLEKAYEKEPQDVVVLEHLGDVYIHLSLHQKAIDIYKKALVLELDEKKKKEIQEKISIWLVDKKKRRPASSK